MDHADDAVSIAELLDERRHLLDVACWMLGSSSEAEGVLDETYRRWYELSDPVRVQITAPRSWLAKVVGGICLARLALPDRGKPHADEDARSPEEAGETRAEHDKTLEEQISEALLDALASLSAAERAAFALNDLFGTAPAARSDMVRRPRPGGGAPQDRARHTGHARGSRPTTRQQHDAMARAVRHACATGDAALLASLLAPHATAFFDGGGKVRALIRPVHGSRQVTRSLLTLLDRHPRTTLHTQSVNGRTGIVVRCDGRVAAVISLDMADHHVTQVWAILNPHKLRSWNRPHDAACP